MITYKNGNYTVLIDKNNGTKVRFNDKDKLAPAFAESCDVTITTKCDNECKYCYLNCNKDGKHADFKKYKTLIESLHPYTEMAINGNDLTHPDLEWFLTQLKCRNIFANITVNQVHFIKHINYLRELQLKGLVYGIGVSYTGYSDKLLNCIKKVRHVVLHTINGITKPTDYLMLLEKYPAATILILGYKQTGRGDKYMLDHKAEIEKNQLWMRNNTVKLIKEFKTVSFDNLALEQLNVKDKVSNTVWEKNYMGDEGKFTFYLDLVNNKYALNSFSDKQFDIDKQDIDHLFRNCAN